MEETPVCIKFLGYFLATGFKGLPLTFLLFLEYIGMPPSLGAPTPLNSLPRISLERASSKGLPVKETEALITDIPDFCRQVLKEI